MESHIKKKAYEFLEKDVSKLHLLVDFDISDWKANEKKSILAINDNHFTRSENKLSFTGSKFHLFLNGFNKSKITLSSPTQEIGITSTPTIIDNVNIFTPNGLWISFWVLQKTYHLKMMLYYNELYRHIKNNDIIFLISPACTLPISYFICRVLKKPLALYIVGDVIEVTSQDKNSNLILRFLKYLTSKWEWYVTSYISRRHVTFVLGSSVKNKLSDRAYDLRSAMTSLVSDTIIREPSKKPWVRKSIYSRYQGYQRKRGLI